MLLEEPLGYLLTPNPKYANDGEERFAEFIRDGLSDDWYGWYPGETGSDNKNCIPDFVLLHPAYGLLIVEVKYWKANTPVCITELGELKVSFNGGPPETYRFPVDQAYENQKKIIADLKALPVLQTKEGTYKGNLCTRYDHFAVYFKLKKDDIKKLETQNPEVFLNKFGRGAALFEEDIEPYERCNWKRNEELLIDFFRVKYDPIRMSKEQILAVHRYFHPYDYSQLPSDLLLAHTQFDDLKCENISCRQSDVLIATGPPASGKTSLLEAWVRQIADENPDKPILVLVKFKIFKHIMAFRLSRLGNVEVLGVNTYLKNGKTKQYYAIAAEQVDAFSKFRYGKTQITGYEVVKEILADSLEEGGRAFLSWDPLLAPQELRDPQLEKTKKIWATLVNAKKIEHVKLKRYQKNPPGLNILQRAYANRFLGRIIKNTDHYSKREIYGFTNNYIFHCFPSLDEEIRYLKEHFESKDRGPMGTALIVRDGTQLDIYLQRLMEMGVDVRDLRDYNVRGTWYKDRLGLACGTLSIFQGLQFYEVILAGVNNIGYEDKPFTLKAPYNALSRAIGKVTVTASSPCDDEFYKFFSDQNAILTAAGISISNNGNREHRENLKTKISDVSTISEPSPTNVTPDISDDSSASRTRNLSYIPTESVDQDVSYNQKAAERVHIIEYVRVPVADGYSAERKLETDKTEQPQKPADRGVFETPYQAEYNPTEKLQQIEVQGAKTMKVPTRPPDTDGENILSQPTSDNGVSAAFIERLEEVIASSRTEAPTTRVPVPQAPEPITSQETPPAPQVMPLVVLCFFMTLFLVGVAIIVYVVWSAF